MNVVYYTPWLLPWDLPYVATSNSLGIGLYHLHYCCLPSIGYTDQFHYPYYILYHIITSIESVGLYGLWGSPNPLSYRLWHHPPQLGCSRSLGTGYLLYSRQVPYYHSAQLLLGSHSEWLASGSSIWREQSPQSSPGILIVGTTKRFNWFQYTFLGYIDLISYTVSVTIFI